MKGRSGKTRSQQNNSQHGKVTPLVPQEQTSPKEPASQPGSNKFQSQVDEIKETQKNAPPNIIVNVPNEGNTKALETAKKANSLTAIGICLNTLLFAITLITFCQTKRSVDISENAMNYTRRNDGINQKRSDIQNEPFLQLKNPNIEYPEDGRRVVIMFQLINLKETPVKVQYQKNQSFVEKEEPSEELRKKILPDSSNLNIYIIKGAEPELMQHTIHLANLSTSELDRLDDTYVYFYNEIFYQDITTGKNRL